MAAIGVVALTSATLGAGPFARLVDSLSRHEAGIEHELLLVLNGFDAEQDAAELLALASRLPHRRLLLHPWMTDLAAYLAAARVLECELICLLNAHSEVLDRGWLAKLAAHAQRGLVGATGTFESHLVGAAASASGPLAGLQARLGVWRLSFDFEPFPNPHVRTNAFMIRRELLLDLEPGNLASKYGAHKLESGRMGLTRQVQRRGLATLVVGRDGEAYPPERWPLSATFRAGGQANLLVADRRTREYADACPSRRRELEQLAWGPYAPAPEA